MHISYLQHTVDKCIELILLEHSHQPVSDTVHCTVTLNSSSPAYDSEECCKQGDHSPDNLKFPDNSPTVHGSRHAKCYSYHARILVLLSVVGVGMTQCMMQKTIYYI